MWLQNQSEILSQVRSVIFSFLGFFFCEPKAPQDTGKSGTTADKGDHSVTTSSSFQCDHHPSWQVCQRHSQRDHEGHCTASAFYHWIHRLQWTLCSSSHSESDSHFHFEVSRLKHIDEDVNSRGIRWDLTDITINIFYTPTGWKHTGKPSN